MTLHGEFVTGLHRVTRSAGASAGSGHGARLLDVSDHPELLPWELQP